MLGCLRVLAWFALACGVTALVPATAPAAADERRVILAWYTADPQDVIVRPPEPGAKREDSLLRFFEDQPALRVGLWSAIQGTYAAQQALLDVSQGTRQATGFYSKVDQDDDDRIDDLRLDLGTRTFVNWEPFRKRARDASRTIRPGLLAGSVPGGVGYVGARGEPLQPAIAAADEGGRVAAISLGSARTVVARARALSRSKRLVVVAVPVGRAGLAQLSSLVRKRSPAELVMIAQLPRTPDPDKLLRPPVVLLRQPAFAISGATGGSPRSGTTRRDGLISSIDIGPTALEWIGVEPPARMRGQAITAGEAIDAGRLEELRRRWTLIRDGRQGSSLMAVVTLASILFLLLGTWRDARFAARPALRIGALGVMWWPTAILISAVLEPSTKVVEIFFIAGVAMALGAMSERLLPWARAPLLPAAVCLVAYTVDLALGGELLTRSVLGPSIASGGRFYGVSNELEPLLPIMLLVGLAAVTAGRPVTRATTILYAVCGLALLVVVGWGRLGADVGGAITVGAGVAVATLVMAPGPITKRKLVLTALAPVAALGLLIVIDLVLAGGSHLTRNLLRAGDAGELLELVTRRYELAWNLLTTGARPALFLAAALAVAFAWRNRDRLYGALPHRAWAAVLVGGLAAGVAGALSNDSGPVLFVNAVVALAALTAYLLGRPAADRLDGPP